MAKRIKDYTIIDAYKSVIEAYEMFRKPGIVFTDEQKKRIAECVNKGEGNVPD